MTLRKKSSSEINSKEDLHDYFHFVGEPPTSE